MHSADSGLTFFCLLTVLSLPVAVPPASRRRSYLPLRTGQCSRPIGTFTLLLVRTLRRTSRRPSAQAPKAWLDYRLRISASLSSRFSIPDLNVLTPPRLLVSCRKLYIFWLRASTVLAERCDGDSGTNYRDRESHCS